MPADRPRTEAPASPPHWGWTVPPGRPEAGEPARAALAPPRIAAAAAIAVGWGLPRAAQPRRRAGIRPRPARAVTDPSPADHQPVSRRP